MGKKGGWERRMERFVLDCVSVVFILWTFYQGETEPFTRYCPFCKFYAVLSLVNWIPFS